MLKFISENGCLVWASQINVNSFLFHTAQQRYPNRPLVEFEIAAQEQMKITELRLAKLFSMRANDSSTTDKNPTIAAKKAEGKFMFFLHFLFGYNAKNPNQTKSCSQNASSHVTVLITLHIIKFSQFNTSVCSVFKNQ